MFGLSRVKVGSGPGPGRVENFFFRVRVRVGKKPTQRILVPVHVCWGVTLHGNTLFFFLNSNSDYFCLLLNILRLSSLTKVGTISLAQEPTAFSKVKHQRPFEFILHGLNRGKNILWNATFFLFWFRVWWESLLSYSENQYSPNKLKKKCCIPAEHVCA